MRTEPIAFNVYWGNRREDEVSCAKRLARMAEGLAEVDSTFNQWLKRTNRRANYKPLFSMPPDVDELARLFDKNRGHYDMPPDKLWPELGFSLGGWAGPDDEDYDCGFTMAVGCYDNQAGVPNHVFLELGSLCGSTDAPWTASQAKRIALVLATAWDPQYIWVYSSKMPKLLPRQENEFHISQYIWPMPGWLTYLRRPYSLCVHPTGEIAVERFPDQSMIATLCAQPFNSDDPRCQKLLAEMNAALGPAQRIWRWDEA